MRYRPMKANNLSRRVAWNTTDPYGPIAAYLTPEWVAEHKIDGCRVSVTFGETSNVVASANSPYSEQFPQLSKAVVPGMAGTLLDGELVWRGGMPTALMASRPMKARIDQRDAGWAEFYAFDILTVGGDDVTGLTYDERRPMLELAVAAVRDAGHTAFRLVEQLPATGESITAALSAGYEGVMLKRRDGVYEVPAQPNDRSDVWLKVKRTDTSDLFIVGYEPGKGGNTNLVGAVKVAWWDHDDPENPVRECGSVGGFTQKFRRQITDPATGGLREEMLLQVIEVKCQEVTDDGRLRHPRFSRRRPDKLPEECGREQIDKLHIMAG